MSKNGYQCPVCSDVFDARDFYIQHLRDEFEDHQTSADMAADELWELGEDLDG